MNVQLPGPDDMGGEITEELVLAEELFGVAGSLRGMRFNGKTLIRALVVGVWGIATLVIGAVGFDTFARIAAGVPRWSVLAAGAALVAGAVVILGDVDEEDVEDSTTGREFHELEWNRRQLYAITPSDVAWALVELSPLVVFVIMI